MRLKDTIGISYFLRSAEHEMTQKVDKVLKKLGLTSAQYAVLSLVEEEASLTNAELARRCSVTPQTMSRIMKNLERDGFVKKKSRDNNKLMFDFEMTGKGKKTICLAHEKVNEIEKELVKDLSAKQIQDLKKLLQKCFS